MDERNAAARIVGRQAELATLQRFVDGLAQARPSADADRFVLIEGPAGIGKSQLWLAGAELAVRRGVRTLRARPAETEADFAYAALGDLLRDDWEAVRSALPRQQIESLSIALGLADRPAGGIEPSLVQAAVSNALLSLAADRPLVLAIDDAQWIDGPTAAVVQFVARRAATRRIGLIVTQRDEADAPVPFELDRAFPGQPYERLWLEPLTIGALHKLLDDRLGITLPRPQLARLHELSGGVPFHALEIARALRNLPPVPTGAPLPIPRSIRDLLRARTRRLGAAEREALLLVAAAGSLSLGTLSALIDGDTDAISAAIDEGFVSIDGETLRAGHPLIASTIYESASPAQRRAAHARLADATDEPEARARHRALSTHGPDEAVAGELEAAGDRTIERGAPERAAELFRLAAERTPAVDGAARDRRFLKLADALHRAADLPAAGAILDELVPRLAAGELLARALMIRCEVRWYTGTSPDAVADAEAAIAAAGDDRRLQAEGHYRLSIFYDFDLPSAHANARAAVALLEDEDPPGLLASALMTQFLCGVGLGEAPRVELLDRALLVEPRDTPDSTTIPGIWWMALDRIDDARQRFEWMLERDRRQGHLSGEANLLTRLAELEIWADRYPAAREFADAATAAARQQGDAAADPSRRVRALVDAHEGRLDEARAVAAEAAERSGVAGDHILAAAWLVAVTCVAVTRGDHAEVDRIASVSARHFAAIGMVEPLRLGVDHEQLEALVGLGRLEDARTLLGALERRQARIPRPWLEAALTRGRALLRMAEGDMAGAIAQTDVVSQPAATGWRRLDRARALLVRGTVLRRARQPREAAAALDEATAIFEAIGARGWLDRVRAEADRLGRRRPGTEALTPSEQQVAELAASGMTNREVADRLSLSPKTVEAHLARTYAKLGIRSRAELGRLMAARADD
ncbi:MAG: LuxR family transcriptional regulator [Chloroflexota bacterium]|nr:MAG: LuxR family transcriptional regulator [Chloroflexota bacterium]